MKVTSILSFICCLFALSSQAQSLRTGAEQTEKLIPLLEGKRVALVVNQTSVVGPNHTHLLDTLLALKMDVRKVFAPEHGFRGNADAGETVKNGKVRTGKVMQYNPEDGHRIKEQGAVLALFFHNARINTIIWIVCILISIVFSDSIVALLTQLLGDGRMSFYSELDNTFYVNKGFRYDFILYSSIPIILGWIVCVKNDLRDGIYEYILATYTIANSGWVLINTIAYSNRFAYLSWFLYPILLAYPFLKFRFVEYQSRMVGILLLFHLSIYLALG